MVHAFASVLVLGANQSTFSKKEIEQLQKRLIKVLEYIQRRLQKGENNIMGNTNLETKKKHSKIRKLRYRNMSEQLMPYGVGMIAKFYPMTGDKDNAYHAKKQFMVKQMLIALSSPEVTGRSSSKSSSGSGLVTSSVNFGLLVHMSQMLRLSHNMADE